jgi:hypothetical protein
MAILKRYQKNASTFSHGGQRRKPLAVFPAVSGIAPLEGWKQMQKPPKKAGCAVIRLFS